MESAAVSRSKAVFTPNYKPAPMLFTRGEGVYLFDDEGRKYLDLVSGIAVSVLGHAHPKLVQAVTDQAQKFLHISNLYLNEPALELAEKLVEASFGDCVFFANSGAEVNEAALKLSRKYAFDRGEKDRVEIISFEGSFHGRTMGALAATAQPKYHQGFEPLPPGFRYLPLNDVARLNETISNKTAAVIVEPIQGEGGVRVPNPGFLAEVRKACDRAGAVLIFDEIQVGLGRTGTMFAHEYERVVPDIMTLAKGLGGGLPIGAMIAKKEVGASLTYGSHGTTFGGNPVAARAGQVVLETIATPGFLDRVKKLGEFFQEKLRSLSDVFAEIRGRGLLIGAALKDEVPFGAAEIVTACQKEGLLVHVAGPRVVRFAPALIIEEKQLAEGFKLFETAIRNLEKGA